MYDFVAVFVFFVVGWITTKNTVTSIFIGLIGGAIYSFCRLPVSLPGANTISQPIYEGMTDRKSSNQGKKKRKKKKGMLSKMLDKKKFPKGKYTFDPKKSHNLTYKGLTKKQMKGLKRDTKSLTNTQEQLMSTLKEMAPVLEQGKTIIGAFDSFFGKGASTNVDVDYMSKRLGLTPDKEQD